MCREDRHARIAEALLEFRFEDALKDIVEPIFGDVPPRVMIRWRCCNVREWRLWHNKMERTWAIWLKDQNLSESDQFHINRELSNVYQLKFRTLKKGERRKYRARA